MIVVTGGLGFIGKNLVKKLYSQGHVGIVVLDTIEYSLYEIQSWFIEHAKNIDFIFHLGAITDTTEMDMNKFDIYNVQASKFIWNLCADFNIPLVYASSAATYGDGELGFDDEKSIYNLKPLNPYGWSKQLFDLWAINQKKQPPHWYGLKFFNVYGYGEADKGKMASVVLHTYNQINENSGMKLFRSHNPKFRDGEQLRDFIYIDDVVDVCIFMMNNTPNNGIYNVGTGKARTFYDLVKLVFKCIGIPEKISYIDIPINIRDKYQYFTEAKNTKLRNAVYTMKFHELEEGVEKYINKLRYENR